MIRRPPQAGPQANLDPGAPAPKRDAPTEPRRSGRTRSQLTAPSGLQNAIPASTQLYHRHAGV
jgi:hypothetical protein